MATPESKEVPLTLLGLCASHINSEKRVPYVVKMLKSVAAQTTSLEGFYMRVSYGLPTDKLLEVRRAVRKAFKGCKGSLYEVKGSFTQFEHYKLLLERVVTERKLNPKEAKEWVIFSDDDDIWHPDRVTLYKHNLKPSLSERPNTRALRLWSRSQTRRNSSGDYVDYTIPLWLFNEFITRVTPQVISHKFCDVLLTSFILQTAFDGEELLLADVTVVTVPYQQTEGGGYEHVTDQKSFKVEVLVKNNLDLFLAESLQFVASHCNVENWLRYQVEMQQALFPDSCTPHLLGCLKNAAKVQWDLHATDSHPFLGKTREVLLKGLVKEVRGGRKAEGWVS